MWTLRCIVISVTAIGAQVLAQGPVEPIRYEGPAPTTRKAVEQPRLTLGLPNRAEVVLAALSPSDSKPKVSRDGVPIIGVTRILPDDVLGTGVWEDLPSGRLVWRLGIRSPGAIGMRLHFTNFNVGKGRVWVYAASGSGHSRPETPFTGRGVFDDSEFWSDVLFGESVVVEYEPEPGAPREGEPPFQMSQLSHLYAAPTAKTESRVNATIRTARVAACHLDVACYPEWADTASGVAMIFFETPQGAMVCSGSLINTRSGSFRPYFLTANHCISDDTSARSVIAFWYYQTSACNGDPPLLSASPRTLGARFRIGRGETGGDFSLLEFGELPPVSVFLNGWDTAPLGNDAPVTGIHHPTGDYKRISFGSYDASTDILLPLFGLPSDKYHAVLYTQGRTQPGSSGSPLFSRPGVIAGMLSKGPKLSDDPELADYQVCTQNPLWNAYGAFSAAYPYLALYLEDTRAHLLSPTPGSTLQSPTATFSWTSVPGALMYLLLIGSTPGGSDIYDSRGITNTSITVSNLPTDGRRVHVRLYVNTNEGWPYNDYAYTAVRAGVKAEITSPPNGSTLPGSSVTFSWTSGSMVSEYVLFIGNSLGTSDIYAQGQGLARSRTVFGLPTDGRTLHVRLFSRILGEWQYNDYIYRAATVARPTQVTLTFTNRLIYAADLYANSSWIGTAQAGETTSKTITAPSTLTVSFSMIRPSLSGTPLGEPIAGVYSPIPSPSGSYSFVINNRVGSQTYFVPMITNRTSFAALMSVNAGLAAESKCYCTVAPFASNVTLGYYRLFSNSNVRAYPAGSGYVGPYIFWGNDPVTAPSGNLTPFVEGDTGILRLALGP